MSSRLDSSGNRREGNLASETASKAAKDGSSFILKYADTPRSITRMREKQVEAGLLLIYMTCSATISICYSPTKEAESST